MAVFTAEFKIAAAFFGKYLENYHSELLSVNMSKEILNIIV